MTPPRTDRLRDCARLDPSLGRKVTDGVFPSIPGVERKRAIDTRAVLPLRSIWPLQSVDSEDAPMSTHRCYFKDGDQRSLRGRAVVGQRHGVDTPAVAIYGGEEGHERGVRWSSARTPSTDSCDHGTQNATRYWRHRPGCSLVLACLDPIASLVLSLYLPPSSLTVLHGAGRTRMFATHFSRLNRTQLAPTRKPQQASSGKFRTQLDLQPQTRTTSAGTHRRRPMRLSRGVLSQFTPALPQGRLLLATMKPGRFLVPQGYLPVR